jgi:cytochrome b subunit of formate dehydrogenase
MGAYPAKPIKEAGTMLSYGSAFWPLFWGIITAGGALTVTGIVMFATAVREPVVRRRTARRSLVSILVPPSGLIAAPSVR